MIDFSLVIISDHFDVKRYLLILVYVKHVCRLTLLFNDVFRTYNVDNLTGNNTADIGDNESILKPKSCKRKASTQQIWETCLKATVSFCRRFCNDRSANHKHTKYITLLQILGRVNNTWTNFLLTDERSKV
jgi:hypothetical protein